VVALAGCGGGGQQATPKTTSSQTPSAAQAQQGVGQRTITISAAQANAQDACLTAEGMSAKPSSAKCARILRDANLPTVIECGGGVSTDSSCVGTRNLLRAFTNALFGIYGLQKQTAAVEGDPVDLATTGNSWVCVLQKPGVRRCQSNRNSQVWVVFPTQTGSHVASAPAPPAKTVTATTTAPAPTSASSPSFSGNGTKSLGTITVPSASTIDWSCSGCSTFGVSNSPSDSGTISIGSSAASGSSAVDAGTYHDVQVISDGNWTIKIAPG
jgi:hypothetical protein